ncbi:shikimate kinase [Pedobacter sp. UYP24]
MRIFLIGFMGCGKTTLGKRFALKMNYEFIDLDHQLEEQVGMTVGAYFVEKGENAFRELESNMLKNIRYPTNCVISTGGGTPCYFDNMEFMNHTGITIYIEMAPEALAKRLEHGKYKRPLIKDMDEEQLIEFIETKLQERNPYYKRSYLSINGINVTPEKLRLQLFQVF